MQVQLGIHKRGSAEQEYSLTMDLPELPRTGDYITILRQELDQRGSQGSEDLIVRRVCWNLKMVDDGYMVHSSGDEPVGSLHDIWIDCEMAIGPSSSREHRTGAGDRPRHFGDDN